MFQGCTSITQAPALPAITLASYCYHRMFYGCKGLTQAPALPATTLENSCYSYIFSGCTSLTQAPALPATTLASNCYRYMFYGCTSLKLSSTKTGEYTQEYRIPSSGDGVAATDALADMFTSTGGTFTGTPAINTTYYLSSDNMIVRETEIDTLNGYVESMIDAAVAEYTSNPLNITGATVGQIAKITAVDGTGKPTEWEAIDIPQSDWEQTDESAADYVKNRPFGNFEHHSIDFYLSGENQGRVEKAPMFEELLNTVGEKTARIELHGSIYCQGTAVTVLEEADGSIRITFTSDDKLNELVFLGQYGSLASLTINKSNITWDTWNTYSLFIDGLTYTEYQKLSRDSVEGTLPYVYEKDYIPVSGEDGSWVTRSIESINPIFQLSGASAGQIVKITAVDESGKPTSWESVDMPSGGGGASYRSWSKVWTLAVAEDIAGFEASNIDLDGKSEIMIVFISDSTASRTMVNGRLIINGVDAGKVLFNSLPLKKDSHSFVIIGRADDGIEYTTMAAAAEYQTYPWQGEVKIVHRMVSGTGSIIQWIAGSTIKITQASATLGQGVTIEIYVR